MEIEAHYLDKIEAGEKVHRGSERVLYRCQKGCLLILVWDASEGTLVYRPAYKLPMRLNDASSTAAGRERHTLDGNRHWKPTVGFFDVMRGFEPNGGIEVACKHAVRFIRATELVETVDNTKPGQARPIVI